MTTLTKATGLQAKQLEQCLSTLRPEARAALEVLEAECGVDFVWVPPGRYPLGLPAKQHQQLFGKGYFANTTPIGEWLEATGFLLSAEPLTAQAYQRILHSDSPALAQARGVLTPTEAEAHRFNHVQHWHMGKVYKVERVEKDLQDPEPALALALESARLLADSLGACLPSWQRWEAAARGPEGFPFPWGSAGWDRGQLRITKLPFLRYWEDPESTMGMGRDSGVTKGEFVRLDDLGVYATSESPLGLRKLVRWGGEWNTAQNELGSQSTECRSCLIRSLTDCGEEIGAAEISDLPEQTRAIVSSNHRAFSGLHCASYGSPSYFPVAAFRLLFAPDTRPLANPVACADPDPRLAELLGCPKNELVNHLGAPQSTDHYSSSTSGCVYSSETWNWHDLGISADSALRQSGGEKPVIVESITLWSNTLRALEVGEKFRGYGRPVGSHGVRLGMSEAEVREREGSTEPNLPGVQVSAAYRQGRLWQVTLRKKP